MTTLHSDPRGVGAPGYPVDVLNDPPSDYGSAAPIWVFCAVGDRFVVAWDNLGSPYVIDLTFNNLKAELPKPHGVNFW